MFPLQAAEDSCLFSAILQAATKNTKHVIINPCENRLFNSSVVLYHQICNTAADFCNKLINQRC
jgi:hypothetical protein